MSHFKTGAVLAAVLSLASAALGAWALQPVPRFSEAGGQLGSPAAPSPAPAFTLDPVVVVADARPVKRAKRKVCDVRGNTHSAGYAVPSLTLVRGETLATVCRWE